MAITTFPPCSLAITDQTLSDWHEQLLPTSEARRLEAHVPTCAGCQARTAGFASATRALQRQRTPDLQDRIWRGLRRQLAQPQRSPLTGRRGIGLISAAATAVALVALFVVLLAGRQHPGGSGTTTGIIAATKTPAVTATVASPLTPAQAWGTAGQQLVTLDAQKFVVEDVLPNGRQILALADLAMTNVLPLNPSQKVVLIDTTTGAIQTIYATTTNNVLRAATDGRYIVWAGGFNLTGGPGESDDNVGYLDTQTGQTHTLISHVDNAVSLSQMYVTHGMLIMAKTGPNATHGVYLVNLATGAQETILPPQVEFTVSWPYLLMYSLATSGNGKPSPQASPPTTLVNLVTGQQTDVTQLLHFTYYTTNDYAMDGATLFITAPTADKTGTQFAEIDHADQPGARASVLFTLPETNLAVGQADSRLLLWGDVWDRATQKLIALPASPPSVARPLTFLSNGFLVYWQQSGPKTQLVLEDEAQLAK